MADTERPNETLGAAIWAWSSSPRRSSLVVDAFVGLVVFVLTALPLTAESSSCDCLVPDWAYLLAAAQTLPLALRRRNPLLTNLLIAPATIGFGIGGWPGPPLPLGALIALHAIAAYGRQRQAWLFLALALVAVPGVLLGRPADADPFEWLNIGLAVAVAWLAGALTKARHYEARQQEARLETERARRRAEAGRAAAEERNRIAREMHDLLGHTLGVMVLLAEGGAATTPKDSGPNGAFELIARVGRDAMVDLRRVVDGLSTRMPADLSAVAQPLPGTAEIRSLVEGMRNAGMKILYQSTLNKTIGGAVGLAAYRVAQESLTNALKHAPGEQVEVSLSGGLNEMRLTIVNKMHSTPTAAPSGHGLRNMRERAASVGGQVDFGWDGRLWTVTLCIPTGIEPGPQTRSE